MQPTHPQDQAVTEDQAPPTRTRVRPKPGERRVLILQALAAMLEAPKPEKITTAALAARLDVSEAALYRHFASKAKMYEGLIEFIEQTFFGLVNQIVAKEPDGVMQARAIALMMLNFAAKNPGMTRVLTGEALVGEDERLAERIEQMLERIEASIRQCLRVARTEAHATQDGAPAFVLPADYDPAARANLLVSYVIGRWHRFAKGGFQKPPSEQADAHLRLILQ
ncbi:nucleoid occlusion factor SlmA [Burkholderia ubonensis]|uniref:nucleoid occlusion factor SlmA n=1 Tax=Burkholderia ubonensis TaxID=101571 RepID=UPI00049282C5|nr:nucleoid occlusion factor SlmA [Burkholderia ubonensis]